MKAGAAGCEVSVLAPAKINPRLEVLRRRPDGYHEIRTWMVALELADLVGIRPDGSGGISLEVRGEHASGVPADGTNLAWRAALAVLEAGRSCGAVGPERGLALTLTKSIPAEAGLGGGSADAAATWVGAERALGLELDPALRRSGLARLGSDCVFFAEAAATGVALCEGRGERVSPAGRAGDDWAVALLAPDVGCPTAEVYRALESPVRGSHEARGLPADLFSTTAGRAGRWLLNQLEGAALRAKPELVPWREAIDAGGGLHYRLCGSGSSFFGLFGDRGDARRSLERIAEEVSARSLTARGVWVTRPAGFGLRFLSEI